MRKTARLILNALSLGANLSAGICVAFLVYVLASTPPDIEWPDSEGAAMLSGISGSFALLLLAAALLSGAICMFVSRHGSGSPWTSGRASLIVSLILGAILGGVILYINFPA